MTILIQNTELQALAQLPDNLQTLVEMIPQGKSWVQAMIADKEHTVSFPSSEDFVEQLSLGLRGTALLYLANIDVTVAIKKLLELNANDLRDLSHYGATANTTSQMQANTALLAKYHLLSNDVFSTINDLFQRQKALDSPLVWSASLNDNILFYDLLMYCEKAFKTSQATKMQALEWANSKAQTLTELAHYYCLYLVFERSTDKKVSLPEQITEALISLTPLVLDNLECPLVTSELDQKTLHDAIVQWHDAGNNLGFTSFSSGLLSVASNIDLSQPSRIKEQAEHYLTQLQQRLSDHLATDSFINQAGNCRHYVLALPDSRILLNLNSIGCLSLSSDRANPTTDKATTTS